MKTAEELFKIFLTIKESRHLTYFDTHVHPFDVLGVHTAPEDQIQSKLPSPSLLEYLEYNAFSLKALELVFKFSPIIIRRSIIKNFDGAGELRLLEELAEAGIDRAVLVPVAPFANTSKIAALYRSSRFLKIGTVDIANLTPNQIKEQLMREVEEFGIKGIKMHPNIQQFFPRPSKNLHEVAKRIHTVYKFARDHKLYLLFHGGISHLLHTQTRRIEYALLENFCDPRGASEIFDYGMPIIIAHAGHYNISKINTDLLLLIAVRYKNVFFDTSGIGPYHLKTAVETLGSDHFVFGSDANYFRIKYNVNLVLKGLALAQTKELFEEKIINVFSRTYQKKILMQ